MELMLISSGAGKNVPSCVFGDNLNQTSAEAPSHVETHSFHLIDKVQVVARNLGFFEISILTS